MAAYAAAVTLLKTLSQLESNHNYRYPQIAEFIKGVDSLKNFLVDNREVKRDFETQIRSAIYEAQDMIDSHMSSSHLLHLSEAEVNRLSFCEDLERSIQKINLIAEMAKSDEFTHLTIYLKMNNSIWKKLGEIKQLTAPNLVGRDEDFNQLKYRLLKGSAGLEVVLIVGVAGMGKTTLAEFIGKCFDICNHFDIYVWVKVPIEYQKREVLLAFLLFIKKLTDEIFQKTEEELVEEIYKSLRNKRYLVVLDDIRDVAVWNDLKELFLDYHNGSRVLVTTRNERVGHIAGTPLLLDRVSDEDSLSVFGSIVFDGELCPKELVVLEKEITKCCRGLPRAVVFVGRLLRWAKLSAKYWEIVLSSINTSENYANLIEALVCLTYKHLPQQLKACILHMAMFPYDHGISIFKLIDLWTAEGFIEKDEMNTSSIAERGSALKCISDISDRSLITGIANTEPERAYKICDEAFHDFVMRTAMEEKFFFVINKETNYGDYLQDQESITHNQHRRLFIRKSIVPLVIHNNYSNKSNSTACSLLYYGPEPQFPLSAWLDFNILKVLDVLKIRFYRFPREILKLILLRYLALSYNGQLPATVCKLHYLQFFIVICYQSVKHSGVPSYLPMEIWNMKELRHLQVDGSDIPDIPSDTNLNLENLFKLSGVSVHSCTRRILEKIPNLMDLEIQIESLPEDESLSFLSHLHILSKLLFFKCGVVYPNIESQAVRSFIPSFPSMLTYLTLGGCGLPWECMSVIAALPMLQKLILQNYAFQGPEWKVKKDEFPRLHFLLIEDLDLKNWTLADGSCFPKMIYLIIRHFTNCKGSLMQLKVFQLLKGWKWLIAAHLL